MTMFLSRIYEPNFLKRNFDILRRFEFPGQLNLPSIDNKN